MAEVEILVEIIGSQKDVQISLRKLAKFSEETLVVDRYYYDPLRTDLQPDNTGRLRNSFRIRENSGKCKIAYKHDIFEKEVWQYSEEHETTIEDASIAEAIIHHLGLTHLVTIKNKKTKFTTEKYEIVLEEVEDLGVFMEVEYLGKDNDIKKIKKDIWEFISSLGIKTSEELNLGKPELMLRKLHSK